MPASAGVKACATVVLASAVLAQQPQQPTFRTEANYVRVDVYPTRDGTPVSDLTAADFEVVENGAPQKIEQFEHVVIRAAGPQDTRVEPNTVADARSMAENPRARLFVLFLDTYHVDVADSRRIQRPLTEALDKMIGPDDMVAVMTPEMSATDITFARKTTTIDGMLSRYWFWGERNRMNPPDPDDEEYGYCYPNQASGSRCADQNGIAAEMIDRRHEKRVVDALQDLVVYLRGVREERKAIVAITNGWLLYRPNQSLMRPLNCEGVPTGSTIGVDPRSGRPTAKDPSTSVAPRSKCQIDRMNLAQIDDERDFRNLLDEANAANASFYPVDPRGLTAFDTPIVRSDVPGPTPPPTPLSVDHAMLTARVTSLRTLAENTDGLAIVDSNDLSRGFRRVVDDLSSYYLLGYYSSLRLDGKFHSITVRVKRPGVQVRARRGYLAATPAAVTRAAKSAAGPATAADTEALAIAAAIAPLGGFGRELPLRLRAAAGWTTPSTAAVWVTGELASTEEWKSGAEADVMLTSPAGETLATRHASVAAGTRAFVSALTPSSPLAPGDYTIRVRAKGSNSSSASNESMTIALAGAPASTGALMLRRGPTTGTKEVPTADVRFRRSEQVRVEVPAPGAANPTARLLDRAGKPLAIPVTAAVRDDAGGARWMTAQLSLAPLAAGDYVIELAAGPGGSGRSGEPGGERTLVGFRIVQ